MIAIQQLVLHLPQCIRQIHMHPVRIFQAQGFLPQRGFFLCTIIPQIHDLRGFIYAFPIEEYGNHQLPHGIAVGRQMGLFPGLDRVEEQQGIGGVIGFSYKADQVGDDLPGLFVVNSLDHLIAWIGDLLGVLRQLDLRDEFTGMLVLDGRQFVYAAEGRGILGGDQVRANTPGIDGSTL